MTSYEDAVFVAAKTGSVEDTQNLLAIAAVNWKVHDSLGNTPLHYAAGMLSQMSLLYAPLSQI
jgi:ankyrin repeat protein